MKLFTLIALCCATAIALGQAKFTTQRFDADFSIQKNGLVDVTEVIAITFKEQQRGLIRKLPSRTGASDGRVRTVYYNVQSVEANRGPGFQPVEKMEKSDGGDFQIRIGSQNIFLNGPVTYRLRYQIQGALTPIEKADDLGKRSEFLWNLLPTAWATDIGSGTLTIRYPEPDAGRLVTRVLAGERGTRRGLQLEYGGPTQGRSDLISVRFASKREIVVNLVRPLPKGQTVTADIALPGSTVDAPPTMIEETRSSNSPGLNDIIPKLPEAPPWVGLIPLLPALLVAAIAKKFWPGRKRPLVVRFDPPEGMGPSLSGTIIDGEVNPRDVVAGIVSLAQKGGAILHHPEGKGRSVEIELRPLKNAKDLNYVEQYLYRSLAQYGDYITPEMLRGSFGADYQQLTGILYREGKEFGYLRESAGTKGGLGCLLFVLVGIVVFASCLFQPIYTLMGAGFAIAIGLFAIAKVSDVTPQGEIVRRDLEGLREFITRAHEKELNYMADTMPDQAMFEKLLPYAVAFDAVRQWTKAFDGLDIQMPDWYDAPMGGDMFWTYMLLNDLSHFGHDYGDAMSYTPPPTTSFDSGSFFSSGDSGFGGSWSDSGGGGFDGGFSSGDGGGGGGGDSW